MKYITLMILMGVCVVNIKAEHLVKYALTSFPKEHWKTASLMFIAGMGDGQAELLQHHYYKFASKFPSASNDFWDPSISWRNKYKNQDPSQGAKFFGSKNIFVFTTDGYHAAKFIQKTAIVGALVINLNQRKKIKYYLADALLYMTMYTAGFYTTYSLIY